MAKEQLHKWVRGRHGLYGRAGYLYFKRCENCGVQVAVPKEEWDKLPIADTVPS